MFLVNLEREGHDHLRGYTCSNCKKASQFVPLSVVPARIDRRLDEFVADYGAQAGATEGKAWGNGPKGE